MSIVLVTGAAGFIGSHMCDQLLAAGHVAVGVDNFRTGRRVYLALASAQSKFRFVEADVCTTGAVNRIAAETRPDAIVHLAALVSVQESVERPDL